MKFQFLDLHTRRSRQFTLVELQVEYMSYTLTLFRIQQHCHNYAGSWVSWSWYLFHVTYFEHNSVMFNIFLFGKFFRIDRKVKPDTNDLPF